MSGRTRRVSGRERGRAAAVLGVVAVLHALAALLLVGAVHAEAPGGAADAPATTGSPSPDQLTPVPSITPAADVYTVGSNLFHLLSGRSPLDLVAALPGSTQPRAVRLDVESLQNHSRAATRQLIARCLAPTPAARYPDARALAQALDELMI